MAKKIRSKVLTVILSTSLGALLVLSVSSVVSITNMRRTITEHSDQLGNTAADDSRMALEAQVRQQLRTLAEDKAALTDEKLILIQNQTKMVAEFATNIYTNKAQYQPRSINYLQSDQVGTTIPHIRTAPGVSLNDIRSEVYLIANAADMLRQITVIDIGITASYIGGESGYFLTVDTASSGPNRMDYDARTRGWYIGAKEQDGLFLTDLFADASGRGVGMTVAMPIYDLSNGGKVLKGAVGSGFLLAENVNKIIDSTKIGETGYAFILNNKGQVVLSPRNDKLTTDDAGNIMGEDYLNSSEPGVRELAQRMLNKESGIMDMEMGGKAVYVAYHPLRTVDWSLGVIVEIDEVITPAKLIQQNILNLAQDTINNIDAIIRLAISILIVVILLASIVTIFVAVRLSNSITAPIISLNEGAKIISNGDLSHRLDVKTDDEIEILANSFNQMISDIKNITEEKQRINSELSIAAEIQNDMLPRIFPTFSNHPYFSIFAKMEPAKEVGGDFYDFFYLDKEETKFIFVIADVSGKGVPAALFMVIAKTLIKQQMMHSSDPTLTLEQVNKILCEDNPRSMFVTTLICYLDLITGDMVYANGGHNPPLISLDNKPYQFMELKKGIPPGMMDISKYKTSIIQLHRGDKIYLYTDGVNEAMNPEGEQWGNDRFIETANKYHDLPPQEFDEAIRREVSLFANGAEQSDDITSIAISYQGKEQ